MSPGSRFQTDPKTITCCYLLYWWGQFFLHFWRKLLLPFHFVPLQHIFVRAPQKNTSQKYVGTVFPRFWRELLKNLTIFVKNVKNNCPHQSNQFFLTIFVKNVKRNCPHQSNQAYFATLAHILYNILQNSVFATSAHTLYKRS